MSLNRWIRIRRTLHAIAGELQLLKNVQCEQKVNLIWKEVTLSQSTEMSFYDGVSSENKPRVGFLVIFIAIVAFDGMGCKKCKQIRMLLTIFLTDAIVSRQPGTHHVDFQCFTVLFWTSVHAAHKVYMLFTEYGGVSVREREKEKEKERAEMQRNCENFSPLNG